jgi:hypothetical protein
MHHRLLATITLPESATSAGARQNVHDTLMSDDSFCGSGGRFGSPLCDWFVIGGRWSGLLAETIIGPAFKSAVIARFPEMNKGYWPQSLADRHGPELDALWREHGGTGPSPYTRSGYEELGYADDAMAITPALYAALLCEYEGCDSYDCDRDGFVDLDYDTVQPDFVGRKWLVVVDYHN